MSLLVPVFPGQSVWDWPQRGAWAELKKETKGRGLSSLTMSFDELFSTAK